MALALVLVGVLVPTLFTPSSAEDPVVTQQPDTNGCQGVRTTPGSENTDKVLVGGALQPGGTATFEISYPVDPKDVAGPETFVITDCVFIDGKAPVKYTVSFVPNTVNFILTFTLTIPPGTPIGSTYCNYAKTTTAPSDSQASNRKAGPACFIVGGDARIVKVDQFGAPVLGAIFTVTCTPTVANPPVVIEGVNRTTYTGPTGDDNAITIFGPAGTPCTASEVSAPPGYVKDPDTVNFTLGSNRVQTFTFVNVRVGSLVINKTTTGGTGTFTFNIACNNGLSTSRQITGTSSARVDDIPVGTVCTVTEVDNPLFTSTVTTGSSPVTIGPGDNVIGFTNVRKTGGLTIRKITVGGVGTFSLHVDCTDDRFDRFGTNVVTITTTAENVPASQVIGDIPTGVTCIVTEVPNPDWVLVSTVPSNGTVVIDADGDTVTFTNHKKGTTDLHKTLDGVNHAGVVFEIRQGASTTSAGTVIATGTTDVNGYTDFGGIKLAPGTYPMCETNMRPGWSNDKTGFTPAGSLPEGADNGTECWKFTIEAGKNTHHEVVNRQPPGGDARTIGYWKNHASCKASKGNQDPVLDEILATFAIASGQTTKGVLIGDLYVDRCSEAVALLNKSSLDGTKRAKDAAYDLAAQLLAAQLNYQAEAKQCAAATTAINQGQALLDRIEFTGTGTYLVTNRADRTEALRIAGILDSYNNNTLC